MEPINLAFILEQLKEDSDYFEADDFELVREGSWEQDYKYQLRDDVYKHKESGRFFMHIQSRSGSPFSDWYYDDPQVVEVVPETKTVTVTTYTEVK